MVSCELFWTQFGSYMDGGKSYFAFQNLYDLLIVPGCAQELENQEGNGEAGAAEQTHSPVDQNENQQQDKVNNQSTA